MLSVDASKTLSLLDSPQDADPACSFDAQQAWQALAAESAVQACAAASACAPVPSRADPMDVEVTATVQQEGKQLLQARGEKQNGEATRHRQSSTMVL